jgi:hypothetical protein
MEICSTRHPSSGRQRRRVERQPWEYEMLHVETYLSPLR